jgi:chorismate mutase
MPKELENLRKKIDKIDSEILQKLAERFSLVSKIVKSKTKNNLPIIDRKREKKILKTKRKLAKEMKLDELMIEKIFKAIIKESRNWQKNGY